MNDEELMRRIEAELGWPAGGLAPSVMLEAMPRWDSMAVLMLISFADAELGKVVGGPEIRAAKTASDLCRVLDSAPAKPAVGP